MCQGWASWRACVELSLCVRDGHRGAPVLECVAVCVRDGHRGAPVLSSACVSGMGIVARLC